MPTDRDRALNTFAIRTFRDIADQDYIASRLAYRADLLPQFMSLAHQALEKYLKCVLFLYRIPAPRIDHDVEEALKLAERLPFKLELSKGVRGIIEHIAAYGPHRYFESPWYVEGYALPRVDQAVWEVRRYCQAIDHETLDPDGTDPEVMRTIAASKARPYQQFQIPGGRLEAIIAKRDHPSRPALIWQNLFFGPRARRKIAAHRKLSLANPPLMLNPEILDDVVKLVRVPAPVQHACRTIWLPEKKRQVAEARKQRLKGRG